MKQTNVEKRLGQPSNIAKHQIGGKWYKKKFSKTIWYDYSTCTVKTKLNISMSSKHGIWCDCVKTKWGDNIGKYDNAKQKKT